VLRAADRVVSLTRRGAGFLDELGASAERVEVVPTGVDCAQFGGPPQVDGDAPGADPVPGLRVGYIGRLDEAKGVLDLLEAFARAFPASVEPGAEPSAAAPSLSFAGTGDALHALRERASLLGLSARVHFRGRIAHRDVPAFLAEQDVLCAPTREVEPFGIVAVEAAAAGLPCFATRIGGLAETVVDGRTGLLVEPGDVGALARGLRRLAEDPSWRLGLGAAARARALALYDWPRITDRFEQLFADVA
jgi:glycosyltransferase involved in cell wall biosynthesis